MKSDMWPKRTGSDGKIHELTVDEKLELLACSVVQLVKAVLSLTFRIDGARRRAFRHLCGLEQLWSDAK